MASHLLAYSQLHTKLAHNGMHALVDVTCEVQHDQMSLAKKECKTLKDGVAMAVLANPGYDYIRESCSWQGR